MRSRIKYSQNFIINNKLVHTLVDQSDISKSDLVIEIGAGTGIITQELAIKAGRVIAFEIDKNLYQKLADRFKGQVSVEIRNSNFLEEDLPTNSFKVFSNIPFNITSQVFKKLLFTKIPIMEAYLFVQKETAERYAGETANFKNSQLSVLLYPEFQFKVLHQFNRNDFMPRPSVNVVLITVKKRESPLVKTSDINKYRDFVVNSFNKKHNDISLDAWISKFKDFLNLPQNKQVKTKGSFAKQLKDQEKVKKIHRTRLDKFWRSKV